MLRPINLREALRLTEAMINRFPGLDNTYWEKLRKKFLKLILSEQLRNFGE